MMKTYVKEDGKLIDELLPAMYLDTSFLIDYWLAEGTEVDTEEELKLERLNELPHLPIVRSILKSEKRIEKVIEIRKRIIFGDMHTTPLYTPASLLELMEFEAEAAFKQICSEAAGAISIQKKSKKEIGRLLKIALEKRTEEVEIQKKQGRESDESSGLEILMMETWLNRGFADCHGLSGLLKADIINFNLSNNRAWAEPSAYAYLQIGLADIMHILFAEHLGCQYFATFDKDFKRIKGILPEKTDIEILLSPDEILRVL